MVVLENKNNITIQGKKYDFGELLTFFLNITEKELECLFNTLTDDILNMILHNLSLNIRHSKNPVIIETSNLKEHTIDNELRKNFANINPIYHFILLSYVRSIKNQDRKHFTMCFFNDIKTIQREFDFAVNEIINKSQSLTYTTISKYNKGHRVDNIFNNFKYYTRTYYKLNSKSRSLQKYNEFYDLDSFLYYDFINLLNCALDNKTVLIKKCRTCNKLFLTFKSDIAYCPEHRNNVNNKNYSYSQKKKNDEHYQTYDKAYNRIYRQYSRSPLKNSLDIFENWHKEAKKILNRYKNNNITDKEFYDFFDKSKSPFKPKNIKKYP